MGAKNSLPMEAVDGFTAEEVSRLEKRFRKLDKDQSETLSVEEFLAMPELKENPIVQRVVQVFDADHSGELDFKEFVKGLAMFTMKNVDREKKLKFLFNIYDMDNDGLISNTELFTVSKKLKIETVK
jgi:serine/threonine-protein phosphatase 2B regulatory subunit